MLLDGDADVGIATEALADYAQLVALPCYRWTHSVIVPPGHALLDARPLTLEALARHPLITYDNGFTGRKPDRPRLRSQGLAPHIVLTAMDADVIKTYVQLGMGVGIVAGIAYEAERDTPACARSTPGHCSASTIPSWRCGAAATCAAMCMPSSSPSRRR